jgi:hypothetical protein
MFDILYRHINKTLVSELFSSFIICSFSSVYSASPTLTPLLVCYSSVSYYFSPFIVGKVLYKPLTCPPSNPSVPH